MLPDKKNIVEGIGTQVGLSRSPSYGQRVIVIGEQDRPAISLSTGEFSGNIDGNPVLSY